MESSYVNQVKQVDDNIANDDLITGWENMNLNNNNAEKQELQPPEQSGQSQKKKKSMKLDNLRLQVQAQEQSSEDKASKQAETQQNKEDLMYNLIVEQFQQLNMQNSSSVVVQNNLNEFSIVRKQLSDSLQFKNLKPISFLGKGSQSRVNKVMDTKNNKLYALKEIVLTLDTQKQAGILQEIQAMIQCQSEYIISYQGAWYKQGLVNMVLEFMDLGSLFDLLDAVKTIPEIILGEIVFQILNGLQYLHKEMRIIHRDIKPANILFNSQGFVKIADFGVSGKINFTNDMKQSWVGTILFMSPERLQGNSYNQTTDVWSLGMICVECLTGKSPLQNKNTEMDLFEALQALNDFQIKNLDLPQGISPNLIDFLEKCLERDPAKRQTSMQLLKHEFIKKYSQNREKIQELFKKWIQNAKIKKK